MVHTSPARAAEIPTGGRRRALVAGAARRATAATALTGLVFLLGACSFSFSVGGSSRTIDPTKVEQKIKEFLPGNSNLKVSSVDCPSGIKEEKGRNFTCSAVIGGNKFTIRVTQTNSSGHVHLERVEAVIDPQKAAQFLESHGFTGVDCGSSLIVLAPGKTFSCRVTSPDGRSGTIPLQVTSRSGKVTVGTFAASA
jgi:hypothetical protein